MRTSICFFHSSLAATVLLVLALFGSTPALAVPPSCKPNPGGTQDCAPLIPMPYSYLNSACSTPALNWPSEEQALAAHFAEFGPGNCPAPTRLGWIPRSAPRCINGPCVLGSAYVPVPCGGEPYVAPALVANEIETMSWLVYEWTGTSTPTGCTPHAPTLDGAVRRGREVVCPRGYTQNGAVCVLSQIDPSKNVGGECPTCGNPISPGTGNKFQKETDYSGSGEFPLMLERYYNSQLRITDSERSYFGSNQFSLDEWRSLAVKHHRTAQLLAGQDRRDSMRWATQGIDTIGANWRHTYQRSIYFIGDATATVSTAFAFRHNGKVLSFVEYNGAFYPQADIADRLTGSPSTGWTYTSAANDEVETYDTDGRLLSIRSRGGLIHTLAYDVDGRLTSVTDDFGHTLTFTSTLRRVPRTPSRALRA